MFTLFFIIFILHIYIGVTPSYLKHSHTFLIYGHDGLKTTVESYIQLKIKVFLKERKRYDFT
jgi:hypothetical protein